MRPFFTYDIETYPNVFICTVKEFNTGNIWVFECSMRRNDLMQFVEFLFWLRNINARLVGFNNIGFDWPVVDFIISAYHTWANMTGEQVAFQITGKVKSIFSSQNGNRFQHIVWNPVIQQIDLFKIKHFDNKARMTSLKVIEFNMRSGNVGDLPYPVAHPLTPEQIPPLLDYNRHDVEETERFLYLPEPGGPSKGKSLLNAIKFRDELTERYGKDFTNHNDTKIGKDYFIMRLEEARPGSCYTRTPSGRQPVQTVRNQIRLGDVIFPYVRFQNPEFQRVLDYLNNRVITETKGVLEDVHATINGFRFDFGTGGIHGSVNNRTIYSDSEYVIIDLDVASYYPNLAIANRVFPQHLGDLFCEIYSDVYQQRKQHAKGTAENAMLKLALNGVYGDSNNKYSPFYDPQYTMAITINGQLLLCMFAEWIMQGIAGLEMIQINTDGLTIRLPRTATPLLESFVKAWEDLTNLELESVVYSRMFIRDVNNYVAQYESGDVKRKNAYEYDLEWHKDHSALVVPKAVEQALIHGVDPVAWINSPERDTLDFMLRHKTPGGSVTVISRDGVETKQQKVTRYYIAHNGGEMFKKSPPPTGKTEGAFKKKNGVSDSDYFSAPLDVWNPDLHTGNKSKYETRRIGVNTGWLVTECNDITTVDPANVNREWYVQEAIKLIKGVGA